MVSCMRPRSAGCWRSGSCRARRAWTSRRSGSNASPSMRASRKPTSSDMPLIMHTLNLGPLDNRTYLIACPHTRQAALIDVGFEPEAAVRAVRDAGLELALLLNTHGHYDHVAGMREVQDQLGGAYWIHPADRPLIA